MTYATTVSTALAGPLPAGALAPDFSPRSTHDGIVNLRDLHARAVILAFCPSDWSPVCSDRLSLYSAHAPGAPIPAARALRPLDLHADVSAARHVGARGGRQMFAPLRGQFGERGPTPPSRSAGR